MNPDNYLVGPVLEFLQEHLPAGLTMATLKVDVAVISISHIPLDRALVEKHPLVSRVCTVPDD